VEEVHGLFAVALPAIDHAEVGHDSCLVLLVAELAKDGQRLLEVLDRLRLGAALGESESEIVERQCFGLFVAEVTDDRQRDQMLLDCAFVVAASA
jgi:hypothetical protein